MSMCFLHHDADKTDDITDYNTTAMTNVVAFPTIAELKIVKIGLSSSFCKWM